MGIGNLGISQSVIPLVRHCFKFWLKEVFKILGKSY